jgi:hypothetical protein
MDLQPWREDETDKRAAVLPVIEPLRPILAEWKANPHDQVKSRKRSGARCAARLASAAGRRLRIRTTVATWMDDEGVPGAQISGIIGHLPEAAVSRARRQALSPLRPANADRAKEALTQLFPTKWCSAARNGLRTICGPSTGSRQADHVARESRTNARFSMLFRDGGR